MIGNDIVDLALALKESNWRRKGYLNKIFTKHEQILIIKSDNPENMVWNLWSRKEAAYKIFNRNTGIRIYNPIQFECFDTDKSIGKVMNNSVLYYTKTEINYDYIHTVSLLNRTDFESVKFLNRTNEIIKIEGIPYLKVANTKEINPISISNHGRFEKIVSLF
jgi:phosphopantetheinyl transferase (holo-ACP synthase)